MVPIVVNENKNIDGESFKKYLIETCINHKSEGRALAFAFIVYDFDNHTIADIINKTNYWNSLDKISGKTLSVFYVNSQDNYYKQRQEEIYQSELSQQKRNSKNGLISFMVPVTKKLTPVDNAINFIKKEFNLNERIKTPFVLFFQIDNEENISDYFIVGLKQERLEDAFLELRNHIKNAVEALERVQLKNHSNHQEIFNLIKTGVESGQFYDFVNKKVTSKLGIGSIISLIRFIAK